jgi:site-specific recombinase XerD
MEDRTALVVVEPALPAELLEPLRLAADFASNSKALATKAAYASDFRIFEPWCRARGISALPASPAAVAGFLADEASAGKRASTLGRRLAAIRYFHRAGGHETPTGDEKVKAVLSGIRRTIGAAPARKKAATADIVLGMVGGKGQSLRELRDRAILLLGFAGAFRRSELVALDVDDLEWTAEGMLVTIRRSKTDQEGLGRRVAIPRGDVACPVEAVKAWLGAANITAGPIFVRIFNRHAQRVTSRRLAARNVAAIVKAGAAKLGFDPATFGGHSLRSGLVNGGQARREPDEDLRPDRPQEPRDAARLLPRRRAVRGQRGGRAAVRGEGKCPPNCPSHGCRPGSRHSCAWPATCGWRRCALGVRSGCPAPQCEGDCEVQPFEGPNT